jgi:hypothetical protein
VLLFCRLDSHLQTSTLPNCARKRQYRAQYDPLIYSMHQKTSRPALSSRQSVPAASLFDIVNSYFLSARVRQKPVAVIVRREYTEPAAMARNTVLITMPTALDVAVNNFSNVPSIPSTSPVLDDSEQQTLRSGKWGLRRW